MPDIFSPIANNFGFHRQFSIQFSDIILHENPSRESRAETCGQPERHYRLDEANRSFFFFCEYAIAPKISYTRTDCLRTVYNTLPIHRTVNRKSKSAPLDVMNIYGRLHVQFHPLTSAHDGGKQLVELRVCRSVHVHTFK